MSKNKFANKNGELHQIVGNHENNLEHEVDGAKEALDDEAAEHENILRK